MSEEIESFSVAESDALVAEKTEAELVATEEVDVLKREDLSSRAICAAYVRGSKCISKPRMVDKMLKPEGMHFNFFAWILGPYYYLYRRQGKIGWVWFAINAVMMIVTTLVNNESLDAIGLSIGTNMAPTIIDYVWFFVGGIGAIVMGFLFYPLYRRSAEQAYDEWIIDNGGQDDAEKYIESKGGTSLATGLISLAIAVILTMGLRAVVPPVSGADDYAGPEWSTTYEFRHGVYDENAPHISIDPETGETHVENPIEDAASEWNPAYELENSGIDDEGRTIYTDPQTDAMYLSEPIEAGITEWTE